MEGSGPSSVKLLLKVIILKTQDARPVGILSRNSSPTNAPDSFGCTKIALNTVKKKATDGTMETKTIEIDPNIHDIVMEIGKIDIDSIEIDLNIHDIEMEIGKIEINSIEIDPNIHHIEIKTGKIGFNSIEIDPNIHDSGIKIGKIDIHIANNGYVHTSKKTVQNQNKRPACTVQIPHNQIFYITRELLLSKHRVRALSGYLVEIICNRKR
jgi:hypothetical protein